MISGFDAYCRGILVRLDAAAEEAAALLAPAAASPLVRGFVAGRSMFAGATAAWLSGQISDEALVADITGQFRALVEAWGSERSAN